MKRKVWLYLVTVAILLAVMTSLPVAAAAVSPMTGDIWSVYNLELNANGLPTYGVAPNYRYTEEGLLIEPVVHSGYTLQTDHAYLPEDGFFLELCVEDPETFSASNSLVFHLWSQVGMIMGYDQSGSGYYGLIMVVGDTHYLVNMGTQEDSDGAEGESPLFGAGKIPARYTADGKLVYTLAAVDGDLYINGQKLEKSKEIQAFLDKTCTEGKVHVGVSLTCTEGSALSAVTVTRFGRNEATAVIPGTNTVPDTPPAVTPPADAGDSETTGDAGSSGDSDEPAETLPSPSDPGHATAPSETRDPSENGGEAPESSDKAPPAEGDDGGDRGDQEENTLPTDGEVGGILQFFQKINVFDNCQSTLGWSGIVSAAVLLSAVALALKKKES